MVDKELYNKKRRERRHAKKKMDIQLIEATILEKWNPLAMGCFHSNESEKDTCPLCQVYNTKDAQYYCYRCPISNVTKHSYCKNTPFEKYCNTLGTHYLDAVEKEIEFLISLLPKRHPWRKI